MTRRRPIALLIADAYTALLREGIALGELVDREIIDIVGERRVIKVPPASWWSRVNRAAAVGAFETKTPEEVALFILSTPEAT